MNQPRMTACIWLAVLEATRVLNRSRKLRTRNSGVSAVTWLASLMPPPISWFQPVAGLEHTIGDEAEHRRGEQHRREPDPRVGIGMADEAVAEPVDHVEEGVEHGDVVPDAGQPVDAVEAAGQKGGRRHHEMRDG